MTTRASRDDRVSHATPRWTIGFGIAAICGFVVVIGFRFGLPVSILVGAAAALLAVVFLTFRTLQAIVEPEEDFSTAAVSPPTPADDQKRIALRAIKDIEYERSIGNVGTEDYEILLARYREDAKNALRAVDEERRERRARAEAIARSAVARALDDDISHQRAAETTPESRTCAVCSAMNDSDARFCKSCGTSLGTPQGGA